MANFVIPFEKPIYKVTDYTENNFYGKFELEPLERGFGHTIGNALRRVLLSSLPGSAISSVKIEGIQHEFQTINGVVEDVTTIILNLKSVVIRNYSEEMQTMRLDVLCENDEQEIKAGDFILDPNLEIVNPDLHIATLSRGAHLVMEITVTNGRGYVKSEENKKLLDIKKVGTIPIDSLYSPVERVSYEVESARVGQNENYDKLILNVWTNGSVKSEEAVAIASKILIAHFNILSDLGNIDDLTGLMIEKTEDSKSKELETPIEELDFSVRTFNCLKRANIKTLKDLVDKKQSDFSKIRNLGKKSLKEVVDKIKDMGLSLRDED